MPANNGRRATRPERPVRRLGAVSDPYSTIIATSDLEPLAAAMKVVDEHAEFNHRYRRMLGDSRQLLAAEEIRLTQARGLAKKLLVLVRAAGAQMRAELDTGESEAIDSGLARANELIYSTS